MRFQIKFMIPTIDFSQKKSEEVKKTVSDDTTEKKNREGFR